MSLSGATSDSDPAGATGAFGGGGQEEEEWELPPPSMRTDDARSQDELTKDLFKVEEEIRTLRQVLDAKERKAAVIRKKLGITPLQLMSKDVVNSFKSLKETSGAAIQKVAAAEQVQKLNQSNVIQSSKSAFSNAATYTKTGITSIGTGMKSGLSNLNFFGFAPATGEATPGASGGTHTSGGLVQEDSKNDRALFAGGTTDVKKDEKGTSANGHGDQTMAT